MSELKKCPFCRSRGIDTKGLGRHYCTNCGANGPALGNSARATWNTRADLHTCTAQIMADERVKALVEAAQAFDDFDQMPTAAKRPDVFELRVRRPLLAALHAIAGGKPTTPCGTPNDAM